METRKKKTRISKVVSVFALSMALLVSSSPMVAKGATNPNLILQATPNYAENTVQFNWRMNNSSEPYTYRLYQMQEGSAEFQSIPAKESVKVLNIYPDNIGSYQPITNTGLSGGQIDLEGKSVPDSGILKTWLLKENIDEVAIDTVSLNDFNNNPSKYLKKINGIWNYDAVFYGMWNLAPEVIYPNDKAVEHLRTFINEGGGFMTSHHTIGYRALDKGVNKLWKEMGVELFSNTRNENYTGRDSNGNLFPTVSFEILDGAPWDGSSYWATGNQVKIVKKGLLTDYPFKVGDIGDVYTIPIQHGLNVFGKGDVWMETVNPTGFRMPFKEIKVSPATGQKGTNNFYVHTYNNTAIINSGHSFPQITQAETRIIANTLFYLSQITTKNEWKDRSGQDLANPNKPTFTKADYDKKKGKLLLTFTKPIDNGTKYTYYVEATNRNNNKKYTSNKYTIDMVSGIKGYSVVVDSNPNTIPDDVIDTTINQYTETKTLTKDFYVHIKAIDNNGNSSPAEHIKVGISNDKVQFDINTNIKTIIKPKIYFN